MINVTNKFEKIFCPRCDFRIPVEPDMINYKIAYGDLKYMCERLFEEKKDLLVTCRYYKEKNQRMLEALEIIAGKRYCNDSLINNVDIAIEALKEKGDGI